MLTLPRCLAPVRPYELHRYPDARPVQFPVCWRPAGHNGNKHRARASYERELDKRRHRRKPRKMTVPAA